MENAKTITVQIVILTNIKGAMLLSKAVSAWGLKFERIGVSSITQSKAQQRQKQHLTLLRR
jgi:hypothetical protein